MVAEPARSFKLPDMSKARPLLFALIIGSATPLLPCAAQGHFSPHQRSILESKSPPPEEYRFGFDLPAGPQFTEAEKEAQRERGREVMPTVMKAFESGAGRQGRESDRRGDHAGRIGLGSWDVLAHRIDTWKIVRCGVW